MKGFWKKNDASDEKKLGKLYHHPQKSADFLKYPNMAEVLSLDSWNMCDLQYVLNFT